MADSWVPRAPRLAKGGRPYAKLCGLSHLGLLEDVANRGPYLRSDPGLPTEFEHAVHDGDADDRAAGRRQVGRYVTVMVLGLDPSGAAPSASSAIRLPT
jgi:hypothetical protein